MLHVDNRRMLEKSNTQTPADVSFLLNPLAVFWYAPPQNDTAMPQILYVYTPTFSLFLALFPFFVTTARSHQQSQASASPSSPSSKSPFSSQVAGHPGHRRAWRRQRVCCCRHRSVLRLFWEGCVSCFSCVVRGVGDKVTYLHDTCRPD